MLNRAIPIILFLLALLKLSNLQAQAIDYSLCRGFFKNHFNIAFQNKDFSFYSGTGEIRPRREMGMRMQILEGGDRILYQYADDDWNRFEYIRHEHHTFRWKWTVLETNANTYGNSTQLENPKINHNQIKYRTLTFRIRDDRCLPGELVDTTEGTDGAKNLLHHNDQMCEELRSFNDEKGIHKQQLWATDFELRELALKYSDTYHLSRLTDYITKKDENGKVIARQDDKIEELLTNVQHLCQDNGYYGPLPVSNEAREAIGAFDLIKDEWYRPDSPYTYRHWSKKKKKKVFIPKWGYIP